MEDDRNGDVVVGKQDNNATTHKEEFAVVGTKFNYVPGFGFYTGGYYKTQELRGDRHSAICSDDVFCRFVGKIRN